MNSKNLDKLINACIDRNIPFVSYRLPGQNDIQTIIQRSGAFQMVESIGEIAGLSGFVYAPFHRRTNYPVVFFEPELTITNNDFNESLIPEILNSPPLYGKYKISKAKEITKEEYLIHADKFIKSFNTDFTKAVLSRTLLVQRPKDFEPASFFLKLTKSYPNAFVHLINIPGSGMWCGATPESLLRTKGELAQTLSLAGTRKAGDTNWTSKEKEEQQIVTRFIESLLTGRGIDNYSKQLDDNFNAGHLIHLATRFEFEKSRISNQLGGFLQDLHPTPAVGGFPKQHALDLIFETELHKREYYSGFCGTINYPSETDLFVNLRCMKIFDDQLAVYVGGGLTKDSVPEEEWMETQRKAETLLSLL